MIKRVFFIFIVLQVLFLGQCYASSDRLTDIGAEVFRERIKKDLPYAYATDFVIKNEAEVAIESPSMAGTSGYEFLVGLNSDSDVEIFIQVYVNREGYIDNISICGPSVEKRYKKLIMHVLLASMHAIGLNRDEVMWLFSKGSVSGDTYEGNVFSAKMRKNIYFSRNIWADGFGFYYIDRMSMSDRFAE